MPDDARVLGAPGSAYAYRAFISYSHRDKGFAMRLHRALEGFRVPAKLVGTQTPVGPAPRRLTPIFRDREELPASPDLGAELSAAIRGSMFLILICSPGAAKSHWVEQEILQFKRAHGDHRVLALIVDGTPNAADTPGREDEECFPRALKFKLGPDGQLSDVRAEPIAADMRKHADGTRLAQLKLIAGLTGLKLDQLVQREAQRRMQRLSMLASGATAGMVLTGGLAFYANAARIEANEQREIAEKEAAAAQAASDFLVETFKSSNPATENPRTITALTILSRSAERARSELSNQPEIQSRLLATLGAAYDNLGAFTESQEALERALPQMSRAGPAGAEAMLALASTYGKTGELAKALSMVRRAEAALGPDQKEHVVSRTRAAMIEGKIHISASDLPAGLRAFERAVKLARSSSDVSPQLLSVVLNNQGLLLSDNGQFAEADGALREALALQQKAFGANHLQTGKTWFTLAQNSFNAGNLAIAERQIANALRIERAVLEPDNPILADTLSMQGQILQGAGKPQLAERALREAVAIYRKGYGGPHYLIGIAEIYLALIESERGETRAALATLADAKRNYDASYGKTHANHGDLLVNRAKILAKAGRLGEARQDCAAGIGILNETLGADASFTKTLARDCERLASAKPPKLTATGG